MTERRPPGGGFTEDTAATPLVNLASAENVGPRRPCLVVVAGPRLGEIFPIDRELVVGRDPDAQLRLPDDEGVSRRHARVSVVGDGALITDLGSANGVWVDGEKTAERLLKEGEKIRIGQTTVLKFTHYDAVEEAAQRQLLEAALRDGLTHAFNRRYFKQRLEAEVRFADRHKQTLALLFIDLDHFKQLNDRHGHTAGDEVLRRLVELLSGTLRAEDVLARWGGEEFAVLARNITDQHALGLAERLRRLVAGAELGRPERPLACTISIGLATFPLDGVALDAAADKLIERADAALYRAKQAGRNQVAR